MNESKSANTTAAYLDQFEKSPYSYPANNRQIVEGVSQRKGSWKPSK